MAGPVPNPHPVHAYDFSRQPDAAPAAVRVVTDAEVEAACARAYGDSWDIIAKFPDSASRWRTYMRAALEAFVAGRGEQK